MLDLVRLPHKLGDQTVQVLVGDGEGAVFHQSVLQVLGQELYTVQALEGLQTDALAVQPVLKGHARIVEGKLGLKLVQLGLKAVLVLLGEGHVLLGGLVGNDGEHLAGLQGLGL